MNGAFSASLNTNETFSVTNDNISTITVTI